MKKKKKKLRVGDKIIDLGQVFRIYKIEKKKDNDGKSEEVIFFKPYYQTEKSHGMICSIPVKNVNQTNIRRPIKKKEFKILIERLKKRKDINSFYDLNKAKLLLKSNKPLDIVNLLRSLNIEKREKKENFSKSKQDVLRKTINLLVQEFALVSKITLEKAREKIDAALKAS